MNLNLLCLLQHKSLCHSDVDDNLPDGPQCGHPHSHLKKTHFVENAEDALSLNEHVCVLQVNTGYTKLLCHFFVKYVSCLNILFLSSFFFFIIISFYKNTGSCKETGQWDSFGFGNVFALIIDELH